MRWLACAWLLVVGCFNPPDGPPYKIRLLAADPPVVSIHGGDWVTVRYEGELPFNVGVAIDGVVSQLVGADLQDHTLTVSAPVHETGTVGIALFDIDRGRAIAFEDDLLAYQVMPAKAEWNLSSNTQSSLDWSLHAELSHPCARGGTLFLENVGDEPLQLTGVRSSNPEFTLTAPAGRPLEYSEYEVLTLCFTSATPGPRSAALTATTNAGEVTLDVSADVAPPLSGLDPTFHGGGLAYDLGDDQYSGTAVLGPGGDGILTWAGMRLIAIDSTGTERQYDIPPTSIGVIPANWILAVRAAPGAGIYVLVVNSSQHGYGTILHFSDALVPDAQFDLPYDPTNPYFDLQVTNGRLLAIGSTVVALAMADGQIDTTYGTNGTVALLTTLVYDSVVDSQGRLYASLGGQMRRVTATGELDASFSSVYTAEELTIDAADRVYVQSSNRVLRLEESGAGTIVVSNGPFGYDVAVDGSGRVYVTSGSGLVNRFTNDVASNELGYGNASSVICPPSGGCYILGLDYLTQVPFATGPDYMDKYVLRLAD